MIDVGLLASIAIVLIVPAVFVHPWPASAAVTGIIDVSSGALLIGIVLGRLVAVAIDDPGSLTSLSDLLIVRSGVEFWPGVAAGLAWIAFGARHDGGAPVERLAAITAPALVAWACYEATCVLRDGCPGPLSGFGMRPAGLVERMLPIGLLVAAAAAGAAVVVRRCHRRGMPEVQVFMLALAALATIRSLASIWLPHIGNGLTRQHRTSITVAVITSTGFVVLRLRAQRPATSVGS
ncbi:MAG: hypothetical protein Q7V62_15525 [Actinomycetota bacterium]|nr:hypothetical protein [Actinomycetota bacterium]